jgi:anti-sigma regulatory factor (Ser/Thr protein kinase)
MKQTKSFSHEPESVTAARQFATDVLASAPPAALEVVTLLVSELASNCIRHTDTGFELTVRQARHEIRVEAIDRGSGKPTIRHPGPLDPNGRGLQIVDMLSDEWGFEQLSGGGKTVWFTLELEAPAHIQGERFSEKAGFA